MVRTDYVIQNISREAVEELLSASGTQPAITMYVPMHTTASPPHISENQIRLKNLISRAADDIKPYEQGRELGIALQDMLDNYYDDLSFWESQTPGLLVCARPGKGGKSPDIRLFHLPVDTDEYLACDEQFHLAPVLAMLNDMHPYYVLTVAQQGPKLFEGDMYGLHETAARLPHTLREALNIDEPNGKTENQGSATGSSLSTGWFNGRGGAKNPQDEDRMKFFRIIDHIVCSADDRTRPLILAGTDSETAEYREISKYPKILQAAISGSYSDAKPEELSRQAHLIIDQELAAPARQAAIEEYRRLEGANPDRVAHDTKAIEAAAGQGRVDKLLAAMGRRTTDTIRDSVDAVTKITFPEGDRGRTLNRLATEVWQMSGTIVNLTQHEMPHGAPMVARLRY